MKQINFQEMSKPELRDDGSLLVHSVFVTIQGEGPYAGMPAVFIRLAGCNLQCPGCDTEYTNGAQLETVKSLLDRVERAVVDSGMAKPKLVVITGGEPFRQNIKQATEYLTYAFRYVQIESNGTLPPPDGMHPLVEVVVSPKAGKVHPALYPYIVAYKYVLDAKHIDPEDGLPTSVLGMPAAPARPYSGFEGKVYVQPADELLHREWVGRWETEANTAAAVHSSMKFGYFLCLQMHKIAGLD